MEKKKWTDAQIAEMPVIVLSLHERWWRKMAAGEKLLEIRKSKPQVKGPFRVLAYITGTGCIYGQFVCPEVIEVKDYHDIEKKSCVPLQQLDRYGKGKALAGWEVAMVQEFPEPKPLECYGIYRAPQSWQYLQRY